MAISKLNTLILDIASGLRVAAPQAILAEVIPQQTMSPSGSAETWLLGFLEWRGEQVPVIDPGVACGYLAPEVEGIHRYAVLYALEHIVGLNYYAVPLSAIPHPVRVGAEDVLTDDMSAPILCPEVAATVQIEGQSVTIPDFPYLEHQIEQELIRL
jgi:chemosensory pili system protein ChpC